MANENKFVMDEDLYSVEFTVEQKKFYIDLKTNKSGAYLKISEKSAGKRHNVIIPAPGLEQLLDGLRKSIEVCQENYG